MQRPTRRYANFLMDSARWEQIPLRPSDIVVATPAKSGTTWVQTLCALLIFQTADLPRPLSEMSVWPEALVHPLSDVVGELAAQRHRRFMKTHIPRDGLPFDERVTYVVVGRDPRDVAVSWDNHVRNIDFDRVFAMRAAAVGPEALAALPPPPSPPPEAAKDRFWDWVYGTEHPVGLRPLVEHLASYWAVRDLPNVVFLHYADLKQDLAGQMRMLADRLDITVPEQRWPELIRAATFDGMRERAQTLIPDRQIWTEPDRFFHRGHSNQWRDLLDDDDLRRYQEVVTDLVAEVADPALSTWVHRGPILG